MAHWKSIWLRARHTENHKEACFSLPTCHPVPGHCPGKRPRGLSAHRAHGGQGAEQKAAEGTGLDDLTLFTAVSTGAGLWPGASPRTRLSSYLSTPKDRWTCLLRSHLTVCTHTHTLTHVCSAINYHLWAVLGPVSTQHSLRVCFEWRVQGRRGYRATENVPGSWYLKQHLSETFLVPSLWGSWGEGRPLLAGALLPPGEGGGGIGRLTPSSSSSSSSRQCMGLTWGSLRTLSSAIIPYTQRGREVTGGPGAGGGRRAQRDPDTEPGTI